MAENLTARDEAWSAALEAVADSRWRIQVSDVVEASGGEVSERTARRVLKAMETEGWLRKTSEGAHYWRHGDRWNAVLSDDS